MTDYAETARLAVASLPAIGQCYACTGELFDGVLHAECEPRYLEFRARAMEQSARLRALRENRRQ